MVDTQAISIALKRSGLGRERCTSIRNRHLSTPTKQSQNKFGDRFTIIAKRLNEDHVKHFREDQKANPAVHNRIENDKIAFNLNTPER